MYHTYKTNYHTNNTIGIIYMNHTVYYFERVLSDGVTKGHNKLILNSTNVYTKYVINMIQTILTQYESIL